MKYIAQVLAVCLLLGSCQKNESVTPAVPGIDKPALDYSIESFELADQSYALSQKRQYQYNASGQLTQYTTSGYDSKTALWVEQSYFTFTFDEGKVTEIKGFLTGKTIPYVEYTYQYLASGDVSSITETNTAAGVNTEANFFYNLADNSVKVAYSSSNGRSFEYELHREKNNIIGDKTTEGSQLCNNGSYTYDEGTNPFRELGYIDFTLSNLSSNNKLTEDIAYLDCDFPTLVPFSHAYLYNNRGYPTSEKTKYKSGALVRIGKKDFFYR